VAIQQIGTNFNGTTDFDVVLKDFYEGPIREHLNNKVTLLKYVERSKRKWSGRQVLFPVHLKRNSGVGGRGETGNLPVAGRQEYVQSKIRAKYLYGRIQLTGAVISASQGNRGSFASAMRSEIDGMRRDLRNDMNRQCFGNFVPEPDGSIGLLNAAGKTGILALVNAAPTGTTVHVDQPGTRYIKAGDSLVYGGISGAPGPGVLTGTTDEAVTSVASNRVDYEVASAAGISDNQVVCRGDASGDAFDKEIHGIDFLINDSNDFDLQTIDVSANTSWKAHVETNATDRPLSLELMQLAFDACDEKGGDEPNLIMCHHSLRREYINLLTSDVRYAPEQLRGGFQKLSYAGGTSPTSIEFDKHATYNTMYFINTADINLYVQKDWGWADQDGSVLSRVSGQDQWEAFMCWYGNLGMERRNTHARLDKLSVSNLIF